MELVTPPFRQSSEDVSVMRFRAKRAEKRFLGAVWIDGTTACAAVASAPERGERSRLVELRECDTSVLSDEIRLIDEVIASVEEGRVAWLAAVRGSSSILESCLVPREVADAPAETRALACLAGTAWGDPDSAAAIQLALSYQLDGERCLIAAVKETVLVAERERVPSPDVRVTAEAVALAELVRAAHPSAGRAPGSCCLAALCSERSASFVIVEGGVAVVARQVSLDERLAEIGRRHARAERPVEAEIETGAWAAADFAPAWRRDPVVVDPSAWRAAVLAELRETLDLYRECGGHASDVTTIFVTGEAAERFELRATLPEAFGDDVDVFELEASRVVTSDDVELARRVAESEAPLAGVFALLAAGRRRDLLAFTCDGDDQFAGGAVSAGPPRRSYAGLVRAALVLLWIALVAAGVGGGRHWWASEELAAAGRALEVEQRRAEELRAVAAERAENEARYEHTLAVVSALESLRRRQDAPLKLLSEVSQRLPQGVTLSLLGLSGADVTIVGESEDATAGPRFALSLQSASELFTDVTPSTQGSTYLRYPQEDASLPPEERPRETFTVRAKFRPSEPGDVEQAAIAPPREGNR